MPYLRNIKKLNSPARVIDFALQKYKDKTVLVHPDKNLELSFKDLGERIKKISLFLNEIGLGKGDVLAFTSANCVEYFEVRAACHFTGVIFFGLPVHLASENIINLLNQANARALFYNAFQENDLKEIKEKTRIEYFIELGSTAYAEIFQKNYKLQKSQKDSAFRVSVVFQNTNSASSPLEQSPISTFNVSSGTTQKIPKILQLTDNNWIESMYNYIRNSDRVPNEKTVFLCALPFLTAGSTTFLPSLLAGVTNIVMDGEFAPERVAAYIKKFNVNYLYITPSRLLELLEWCKQNNEHFDSLKNIITGTERIPSLRLNEAIDYFGPIIYVGYGMVEALPPIAILSPECYLGIGVSSLASVGRVTSGVIVKIIKDGRIVVKSKTVSAGYLNNPEENANRFKYGWYFTDDCGFFNQDGLLSVLGRQDELLMQKPRIIFAREVEERLYEIACINRCVIIAKNEKIFLFASLREKLETEKAQRIISEFYETNFKELPKPEKIVIKENLPVNSLGKLDRKSLIEEAFPE